VITDIGYMLLGGRLRESCDQQVVLEAIEKQFKCVVNPRSLFGLDGGGGGVATRGCLASLRAPLPEGFGHLVWTDELLKMAVLVYRCLQFDEPVLLVGNTG
jgi:midasin